MLKCLIVYLSRSFSIEYDYYTIPIVIQLNKYLQSTILIIFIYYQISTKDLVIISLIGYWVGRIYFT